MYSDSFIQTLFFNLFHILSADPQSKLSESPALKTIVKNLQVDNERLNRLFHEWKATEKKICALPDPDENRQMISILLAADNLPAGLPITSHLRRYASDLHVAESVFSSILKNPHLLKAGGDFAERQQGLYQNLAQRPQSADDGSSSLRPRNLYIANQISPEGLDELQRLVLAHFLGLHVALDGPPGVGKTQSIMEMAHILKRTVYTRTCSSRTTDAHIISHPSLIAQDGVSVTEHINGPLARAMAEGAIFYGDEFNLLKDDVQKRLNSAFDDRRFIDRADGVSIQAQPGFWSAISYNPSQSMVARDLDDSVADRFVHLHYKRWSPDFKALISRLRSIGNPQSLQAEASRFDVQLKWRGISDGAVFYDGQKSDEGSIRWFNFYSGKESPTAPQYQYLMLVQNGVPDPHDPKQQSFINNLAQQAFAPVQLARMLARFTEVLHDLKTSGRSPLLKKIGLSDLNEKEDLELLDIHDSSARIEMAAMLHYEYLCGRGWNRYLAQSYAARLVVDQICYGQYRQKKLRDSSVYDMVTMVARNMRLFADNRQYNTRLITQNVLNAEKNKSG
ncbi:MAG: AAA family ATPase [Leptospiraceae bacterium]|nr:AAA family ATPase [Leptospiraceae bacterium]